MPKPRKERGRRRGHDEEPPAPAWQSAADEAQANELQGPRDPEHGEYFGSLSIDEEAYFRNVTSLLEAQNFESEEEKQALLHQVLSECEGEKLFKAIVNPFGSKAIEACIRLDDAAMLQTLLKDLNASYVSVLKDIFGSRVIETALRALGPYLAQERQGHYVEGDSEEIVSFETLVLYMCNEILPQFRTLLFHRNASHALRALLLLLQGHAASGDSERPVFVPFESFSSMLHTLYTSFCKSSLAEVRNLSLDAKGSPVLQLLLAYEARHNESGILAKLLPQTEEDTAFTATLIRDSVGSHLVERLIAQMSQAQMTQFAEACLKGRYVRLAKHPSANYALQAMLKRGDGAVFAAGMLEELSASLGDLLASSQRDVVVALAEASASAGDLADTMATALVSYASATMHKPLAEFVRLALADSAGEFRAQARGIKQNQALTLIMALVKLGRQMNNVLQGINGLGTDALLQACLSREKTHLIQAVLRAPQIGKIERKKLLNRFSGLYAQLAQDFTGTFVVDACWCAARDLMMLRERMLTELYAHRAELRASYYGNIVMRVYKVDLFGRKRSEWAHWARQQGAAAAGSGVHAPAPVSQKRPPVDDEPEDRAADKAKHPRAEPRDEIDEIFA